MMLDKQLYETFETALDKYDGTALKELLSSCQKEALYDMTRLYMNDSKKELTRELKLFRRFQRLLSNGIKDVISYEIGILAGIYRTIEFMTGILHNHRDFEKEMEACYQKANVKEILMYLREHPNAQHKVIAEELKIKPNRLSQIMQDLEKRKCILRYGVDRRCFYELSLDGQAFLNKKTGDNGSLKYTENLLDKIGLLDKGRMPYIVRNDSLDIHWENSNRQEMHQQLFWLYNDSSCCRAISKWPVKQWCAVKHGVEANKIG